jgi:acyl-CoA dehydrogenase
MNSDEARLLIAAIEQIFDGHRGGPREFDEPGLDSAAWRLLTEAGFSLVSVPEEAGGSGGTLQDAAVILRAVSRIGLAVPLAESTWLAAWALASAGVEVPRGPLTAALLDDAQGELARTAGSWQLNGVLRRVPWAADVEFVVGVLARERPARVVLLDPGSAELRPCRNLAGEPRVDVVCPGLLVDDAAPACSDDVTAAAFRARAAAGRVVAMSGAAEQALHHAVTQAGCREQFGRPLARFQAVQHLLARMAAETTALVVAGQAAVATLESGSADEVALAVAAAKAAASDAAGSIAAWAHQVLGAMGFAMEHPLQRSTRRLWAWRDEYGNECVHGRSLAQLALASDPWSVITGAVRR